MKIMILDDNPEILSMVTIMLHSAYGRDCQVISGRNGTEGLALLHDEDTHPDLILTNLRMPSMDGLRFVTEVRLNAAWNAIHLIMMSALSGDQVVDEATARGAEAFLPKPFTFRDLTAVINQMMSN